MQIQTPDMEEVAAASTYLLLLWWCLIPFDPDDNMVIEAMILRRLSEQPDHVATVAAATGLEFDAVH
jgi:hypothetical protein